MKLWKQMGLAVIVASLMMGYGQVSAQVHDDTYSAIASTKPMAKGEVGVPSSTILDAEKKRQTGDEIMAEFDAMLEQNPLVKDYTGLKNMKEGLKLGHYMDVYELQGADQYGLNTAWVLVFPLPKELLMNAQSSLSYGKEGLSSAEMDRITRDANDLLNHFNIHIAEDRDIDYSQNKRPAKIRLRNVEPLHTLTDTKYGTMTTAGNMTYDITGIQYPGYLRLALVGTPEYLTTIVMGTTEVEGTFFKPYFLQMLQHMK